MARTSTRPREGSLTMLASAPALFSKSYAYIKENLNVYAVLYFVPLALVIAEFFQAFDGNHDFSWSGIFDPKAALGMGPDFGAASYVAGSQTFIYFLLMLATIIASLMLVILNLRVAQRKTPTLSDIWHEFKLKWWRLLLVEILYGVVVIVGLFLIIIPGLIFLWRFYLAPYLMVDKDLRIIESFEQSWDMTKGYAWPIYSIILFSLVLSVPNIIPYIGGIIAFLLAAAYSVAPALRYQELTKQT